MRTVSVDSIRKLIGYRQVTMNAMTTNAMTTNARTPSPEAL
jgi:hypothetical protein